MIAMNSVLSNEFSHFLSSLKCGTLCSVPSILLFPTLNSPSYTFRTRFNSSITKVGGNEVVRPGRGEDEK